MGERRRGGEPIRGDDAGLGRGYGAAVDRTLSRPLVTLALASLVFFGGGALAYARPGSGFLPTMDEGGFVLDYKAPPGSALSDTVLALSPLALGLGEGSGMQKPLAIAIISGLIAGAPLVLLVLPAALLALSGRRRRVPAP